MHMSKKKSAKTSLKLLESESTLPKIKIKGEDELAILIRSINEKGKSAKTKAYYPTEPQPPKAA